MRSLTNSLAGIIYAAGWALVKRVPEPVARTLFRWAADAAWLRRGRGVHQLEANLRRVIGPENSAVRLRQLSRAAMRSYSRYWLEVFRLPVWTQPRIRSTFHLEFAHRLHDPLAIGRGVVVVLPHAANWDHAGAYATLIGAPVTTVAERLRPESLFDRFVASRRALGMEVLPLSVGGQVFGVLAQRLRAGGVVCLVGDRDLSRTGVEVDFFGERTRMPGGPAALAVQTGAALLPATLWYSTSGTHLRLHPEVPIPVEGSRTEKVAVMTQQVANVFAAGIATHPEDWHMLQPLWLEDLTSSPARVEVGNS